MSRSSNNVTTLPESALLSPSCPGCWESTVSFLEFTSAGNDANHFQCAACGHVWVEPKAHLDGSVLSD
jgi:ribosomal protein S27E